MDEQPIKFPTKPEVDPAKHESPQAYAEAWWRYNRDSYTVAWERLRRTAQAQADGTAGFLIAMSQCGGVAHDIEYYNELAQLFDDVYSTYLDPSTETDGFTLKSWSLGRDLIDYRPITHSSTFQRWAEEAKREARADFLKQCMPLLDADYLLGRR